MQTQPYPIVELFAGGGMASVGLGSRWTPVVANDFDSLKASTYLSNHDGRVFVPGDVSRITAADIKGCPVLLWAYSPCQDLSTAGLGAGLEGERSSAFFHVRRIVDELSREGRAPKMIVIENVVGAITRKKGAAFSTFVEVLARLGYRVGALVANANLWVPQSRARLFVIAVRADITIPDDVAADGPVAPWHTKSLRNVVETLPRSVCKNWLWLTMPVPEPRTTTIADVLEDDPDVPWESPEETAAILATMAPAHRARIDDALARSMDGTVVAGTGCWRTRKGIKRAEVKFDEAYCLLAGQGGASFPRAFIAKHGKFRTRFLTSRECARLMGLPDDFVLPEFRTDAYRVLGDGVAVPVVRALAEAIFEPVARANPSVETSKSAPSRETSIVASPLGERVVPMPVIPARTKRETLFWVAKSAQSHGLRAFAAMGDPNRLLFIAPPPTVSMQTDVHLDPPGDPPWTLAA